MADDLNEAGRCASRQGYHALAERLFARSFEETGFAHSGANAVYEQYVQGKVAPEDLIRAVQEYGIAGSSHGEWLLRQAGLRLAPRAGLRFPADDPADDVNQGGRCASREGNHALAERLFARSYDETGYPHSGANVVYERYVQGKASADDVAQAAHQYGIGDTGHGKWLLRQVGR